MQEEYIILRDGKRVFARYLLGGFENTLLLIHGGPGNGIWDLMPLMEEAGQFFNVIAFDERGVNKSDAIAEDFTSEMLIDDIEDVKQHFGLNKVYLMGHSYGGHLLLRYCLKYPESVCKAFFLCPSFDFLDSLKTVLKEAKTLLDNTDFDKTDVLNGALEATDFPGVFAGLMVLPENVQNEVYGYTLVPEHIMERVMPNAPTESELEKSGQHQQAVFTEGALCQDMTGRLNDLSVPSVLIVGEKDPVCSLRQREKYNKFAKSGKTVTVKDSGHFPYMDSKSVLCGILKENMD